MKTYQEPNVTLYQGHALEELKVMPGESVDMVMTSPPYWGLRSYKTEPIVWGNNECGHEWGKTMKRITHHSGETNPGLEGRFKDKGAMDDKGSNFCLKCSAWRGELGLEPTIELYIEHLLLIFDEVKRVLKRTGSLWVNLGDSYNANYRGGAVRNDWHKQNRSGGEVDFMGMPAPDRCGVPAKSLCAIPERFVLGMMDRGWIRRNTVIWHKNNPMPESVKDRFTDDFEYLFFFVKNKTYWFEQQFEASELSGGWHEPDPKYLHKASGDGETSLMAGYNRVGQVGLGRNKRCVWTINTEPYPEAHFATFPEKLCETPILAGCPQDGVVLDPFAGSGTTLAVAKRLGRKAIGIELNPDYCKLIQKRLQRIPMAMEAVI